jgi:long-chain acyl-CoA synthetase
VNGKIQETLEALRARLKPAVVDKPTVYYLSLGDGPGEKWTVTLTPDSCQMVAGRVGNADCVLKMPGETFIDMVRGAYRPRPMDFVTGKIKTNDIGLLMRLQEAFGI